MKKGEEMLKKKRSTAAPRWHVAQENRQKIITRLSEKSGSILGMMDQQVKELTAATKPKTKRIKDLRSASLRSKFQHMFSLDDDE